MKQKDSSKSALVLMTQLAMLLVFAVAAGICLRAFSYAYTRSHSSSELNRAVTMAQAVAETIRHYGSFDEAKSELYTFAQESEFSIYFYGEGAFCYDGDMGYTVTVCETENDVSGLKSGVVCVFSQTDNAELKDAVFSLDFAFLEVMP